MGPWDKIYGMESSQKNDTFVFLAHHKIEGSYKFLPSNPKLSHLLEEFITTSSIQFLFSTPQESFTIFEKPIKGSRIQGLH